MAVEQVEEIQQAPVRRWRFTVDDYYRMGEVGILPHDARVELVDGDAIELPPVSSLGNGTVASVRELLHERIQSRATIGVRGPPILPQYGAPQPDILVLRRREDFYRSANPTAEDVLFLIEVSDSTLAYDRDTKGPIYARAGIPEYWIVKLRDRTLLVHREPVDGVYRSVAVLARGDTVQPLAFPDVTVLVADLL